MKIRLVPENKLEELKASVKANLSDYRAATAFHLDDTIDVDTEIDLPRLDTGGDSDCANVIAVYQAMKGLAGSIIRDKRFWTHLTHVEFIGYTAERWKIPTDDDEAVKRVTSRFFADSDREVESRNAMSRLFWTGRVCSRFADDFEQAVEALTYRETILADMIERPTTIEVPAVFNAMIRRLIESLRSDKALYNRALFRDVQKEVNLACGSVFIESLSPGQVQRIVDGIIEKVTYAQATNLAA